ncbi:MAG: hypothetical protein A2035_09135 [Nitrospirae bacterium GWA2_42_11]|nr:MAG: hypothetical protein A2035_09135 [Nitrospirae bacterium GWA2_42_11]
MSDLFKGKYRWPEKGDNPFIGGLADSKSPTWASLQWLGSLDVDDSFLAGAFKEDEKLSFALKKDHNLYKLWNYVKRVITQYWPDGPKEHIGVVERIIQEFHNIDKSGQNFRYSEDTSGRKTLDQLPDSVELIHLKDVFDGVFNLLIGCENGLYEALKLRSDMLSSYM